MLIFLVGALVSIVATGLAIPLLHRAEIMDVPNARSSHRHLVPRGGGLGVLAGVGAATLSAGVGADAATMLAAALAAAAVGLLDDLTSLSATTRLGAQLVLSAGVVLWLVRNESLGLAVRATVLVLGLVWLVGYVNAFNFMDGINGISAFSAAVAGSWYAWLGQANDIASLTIVGLALAGAALGFVPWNALRAKVFMGDVGSYGIGMLIACLAFLAYLSGSSLVESVAPVILYLVDTAWALLKRVRRGDSWREAHREHVYQRLVDAGWSHPLTAMFAALMAIAACLAAAALTAPLAMSALVAIAGVYLGAPRLAAASGIGIAA